MSETFHPGYIDFSLNVDVESLRKLRTFEGYRNFIHTEGLDECLRSAYITFLHHFFDLTKQYWEPTRCTSIPDSLPQAQLVLSKNPQLLKFYSAVEARRFSRSHFWLQLQHSNNPTLIIDPTGVPRKGVRGDEFFIPHFGLIEKAADNAQYVYSKGEPLDEFETTLGVPGFHP